MQILKDADLDGAPIPNVYRETAWAHLASGLIMAAMAGGSAAAPALIAGPTPIWGYALSGLGVLIFGAIAKMAIGLFRASLRPESWILRWSTDALYIRFRSYQNRRFDPDTPTVVKLGMSEIAWARGHTRKLQVPDEDGDWTQTDTLKAVEIGLRKVDTAPLVQALREEAKRRDAKRSRFNHYPLTLDGDGVLRVEMKSPQAALKRLAPYFPVTLPVDTPLKKFRDMTTAEKEDHILALAQSGNKISAIKATRELYGCNLSTAKGLVNDLIAR